jgi:hypothetical protein
VLAGNEKLAFNLSPAGLERLTRMRWQGHARQLNDDGEEDPNGEVHLEGWDLRYDDDPANIDLAIHGSYDPQSDFTLHVSDYLTPTPDGFVECATNSEAEPTGTAIDPILASIARGTGGGIADLVSEGLVCKIAELLPRTMDLPDSQLAFSYTRTSSDGTTYTDGGSSYAVHTLNPQPRTSWPR